ncbi:MAG: hypothetical protein AAGK17_14105 [Pseudomonadota bacterium]
MEFHYGLWIGVSALYSQSGRQLGEENARPFLLNHHLPTETLACKYDGSRNGHTINISALRIAMQNFDDALEVTRAVSEQHLKRVGKDNQPGIWDLYIIARASMALIAFQKRFIHQANPSPIVSDILASQYQFISGIFMIGRAKMQSLDPRIFTNDPVSSDELYAFADEHGIFISPNGWACAGSTKKIMEFIEFCNEGAGNETGADLAAIVSDPQAWYRYAIASIELDCLCEAERVQRLRVKSTDRAKECEKAAQIYSVLGAYCRNLDPDLAAMPIQGSFESRALTRQNLILGVLGRPPVTSLSRKAIEERLGGDVLTV